MVQPWKLLMQNVVTTESLQAFKKTLKKTPPTHTQKKQTNKQKNPNQQTTPMERSTQEIRKPICSNNDDTCASEVS